MDTKRFYEVTRGLQLGSERLPAGTRIEGGVGTPEQIAAWLQSGAIRPLKATEPVPPPQAVEPRIVYAPKSDADKPVAQPAVEVSAEQPTSDENSENEVNNGNDHDSRKRR